MFQSTRPHGARHCCSGNARAPECFNPRARTGRDREAQRSSPAGPVSIHAPARGATVDIDFLGKPHMFQSTRPHGARPKPVSYHGGSVWFQSTRPHGARPMPPLVIDMASKFQSTRPHGARRFCSGAACAIREVSIHAPARGATPLLTHAGGQDDVSIHAPARGATTRTRRAALQQEFQSTRPHGARPSPALRSTSCHRFNPRARTGRDVERCQRRHVCAVSIHAPARGATTRGCSFSASSWFQSTRPHGARRGAGRTRVCPGVFQSTRPHGARPGREKLACTTAGFQSTRPHGARHYERNNRPGAP
ncbi:hypothetical protein DR66_1530 [Delftia acidovorans]|nr:hypothetical protein DR66_1530 [Delftia acidovorans]